MASCGVESIIIKGVNSRFHVRRYAGVDRGPAPIRALAIAAVERVSSGPHAEFFTGASTEFRDA